MTGEQPGVPLEEPACPLCAGEQRAVLASRSDWEPCRVVRCRACRLAYLCPRPTEAAQRALYASDAYFGGDDATPSGYDDYAEQELALRLTFRRWLRTLRRNGVAGGALLEVGCGNGYLLAEAGPWFERREGTELSPRAARRAAKYADEIHAGGLDAVPGDRRYDVVLSNHVIEHVYAPEAFLRAQLALLRPGGALVTATPWMSSAWQRLLGRRWPSYKIPEHVLYFDPHSLARLLQRVGLERLRRLPYLHAFPLALVGRKLELPIPARWGRRSVWIPGTTLGVVGYRPSNGC